VIQPLRVLVTLGEHRWIWRAADPNLFRFTVADLRELDIALTVAFAIRTSASFVRQTRSRLRASASSRT